jgi:hypothetical protein
MTTKTYEGWANRQTWNVALWINNDYALYTAAVNYVKKMPFSKGLYRGFIVSLGMENDRTPDRIAYLSTRLNYKELDVMMEELKA